MTTVYDLNARLVLAHGSALAGLGAIASVLTSIHGQVGNLNKAFVGLGSIVVGGALLASIEHLFKRTAAFSDELVKLRNLGGPMEALVDSGAAGRTSFDIAKRVPLQVADILKSYGTGYSMFGHEQTPELLEAVAKAQWVLQFNKGYQGESGKDMQDLMRAGEQSGRLTDASGKIDPGKVKAWLDMAQQIVSGSHGMVTPQTLLGLTQQGGFALRGLSEKGFMGEAIMAQVMGGQRAGTATLGIMQQLSRGTITKTTAQGMEDAGMLAPGEWSMAGKQVVVDPTASKRLTAKFANDPMDIAAEVIKNLNEKGITDPMERLRRVLAAYGRQTTQRFSAEEVMNFEQQIAERDRWMQGAGVGKANEAIMGGSVTANLTALGNAWTNLLTAFAGPSSENFISVLQSLTSAITATMSAVAAHPDASRHLMMGASAIAGALVILGGAAVVMAASALIPGGAVAVACIALANIMAMYGALDVANINTVITSFNKFVDLFARLSGASLNAGIDGLVRSLNNLVDAIMGFAGRLNPFHKSSFEGGSPFGGAVIPVNFDPSNKKQILQPISLTIDLDGRTLGQAMTEILEDITTHPTGAPSPNGWDRFRSQSGHMDT